MNKKTSVAPVATKTRKGDIETSYALQIFRSLYLAARCGIHFYAEDFNMSLVVKEGGIS